MAQEWAMHSSTMAAMRILVVTNLYPPQELGGYGRSLADFVWGLQQRGHTITVLTSDAPYLGTGGPGPSGEGVRRDLKLKGSFEGGVSLLEDPQLCQALDHHNNQTLQRQLLAEPYGGVLLGNIDLLGPELLPALLASNLPVLHHVGFMAPPFTPQQWPVANHYTLVAASRAVRTSLQQAGLPVAHAPVVYPGARVELFEPRAWSSIHGSGLGSASQPLKLCFAGLLMGSKGAHTLVEAAARLRAAGFSIQVNLAGQDFQAGYWEQLQRLAARAQLEGLVRWVGPLQRPQLARFFQLHHVGVFPSIYPEAFGIVGAEMLASGLGLVSSGVGGAAELLEHDISGLRFEAGNATSLAQQLSRLMQEPGLLAKLRAAGLQRVHRDFNVAHSCRQLEDLWQFKPG
ncbi:MAG: glycosyltransferase family 4 protein [Cyanobacteria bacterium M_surface_7_m2_040]|nr:glycosyltransferase family 4 protein [Cyanobacteria bacterium M_surface_7_m2_040]